MTPEARDIIGSLCNVDVSKRLGNIRGGASTVKAHPWFRKIDWESMQHRRVPGPIIPHLRGPADTRNFDDYDPEPEGRAPYTTDLRERYDPAFSDF
jgi:protein kinase A